MLSRKLTYCALAALALVVALGCGPAAEEPTPGIATAITDTAAFTATVSPTSLAAPLDTPATAATPAAALGTASAMIRGNPAHTGVFEPAPLGQEWMVETGQIIVSSPAVVEGIVYFGSANSLFYAVELETGEERWTLDAGAPVVSSPAIAAGAIAFGTMGGQLYLVDLATGQARWTFETTGSIQSSPAVASGAVYVGSDGGTFYAVDLETGQELWQFKAGGGVISSPAVLGDTLCVGSEDGNLYAVDLKTGEERWRYKTDGPISSSPAIAGATVFVGSSDRRLHAVDLETGQVRWSVETGEAVVSSPAVADGTVYIGSADGLMRALDAGTGEEQWQFQAGALGTASAVIVSSPAVAQDAIYFGALDGRFFAVSRDAGQELWHFQTEGEVWSSPAVAGEAVVFGSYDGRMYALRRAGPELALQATPAPPPLQPTPTLLPEPQVTVTAGTGGLPWWNDRIFYEVFVRSFYDSDGDGIGDLQGLIEKLDYLNDGDPSTSTDLGVTGIWLMPVAESPSYHGYDVVDYYTVEADYGTNADFLQLMDEAHQRGIAVIVDLVLNHTSNQHPWFQDALTPGSEHESWYVWTTQPEFYFGPWGAPAWHKVGLRYYYGLFWEGMPDLNFGNGAVTEAMYDVIRFWLEDMGVDGFRLDAIRHLIEDGAVQENTPATHAWLKGFLRYVRSIAPDAWTVGEVWTETDEVVKYVGEELDVAFEFDLARAILDAVWRQNAEILIDTQQQVLEVYPEGQYAAFLTNHDQNRVMNELRNDVEAAKAAATLLLTNQGVPFIYYGEEIGMRGAKPDPRIRTPMHWDSSQTAGFTTGAPWEQLAEGHETANVGIQNDDPDSLLDHYRRLIRLRQEHPALRAGDMVLVESDARQVYGFLRYTSEEAVLVVVNLSKEPVSDYRLTLGSGPLEGDPSATLRLGEGELALPQINAAGGFDAYTPLATLPARGSAIILLEP